MSEMRRRGRLYNNRQHTKAMSDGLFELRVKGKVGIDRVFYCTKVGKRIIMLNGFVENAQKTPGKELHKAQQRLREVQNEAQ